MFEIEWIKNKVRNNEDYIPIQEEVRVVWLLDLQIGGNRYILFVEKG